MGDDDFDPTTIPDDSDDFAGESVRRSSRRRSSRKRYTEDSVDEELFGDEAGDAEADAGAGGEDGDDSDAFVPDDAGDADEDEPYVMDGVEMEDDFIPEPEEPPKKETKKKKKSPAKRKSRKKKSDDDDSATPKKKAGKKKATPSKKAGAKKAAKKKPKSVSEKDGEPIVLEYMTTQNRPYSSQNVFDNLHGKVKKAHAVRILAKLAKEEHLVRKDFGKAKIYHVPQDPEADGVTQDLLDELDEKIAALTKSSMDASMAARRAEAEARSVAASLTDAALEERLRSGEEEVKDLEEKVEALRGAEPLDEAVLGKLTKKYSSYRKEWVSRKRKVVDMVGNMSEGMNKKPRKIYEMLDIETDDMAGVVLPAKRLDLLAL